MDDTASSVELRLFGANAYMVRTFLQLLLAIRKIPANLRSPEDNANTGGTKKVTCQQVTGEKREKRSFRTFVPPTFPQKYTRSVSETQASFCCKRSADGNVFSHGISYCNNMYKYSRKILSRVKGKNRTFLGKAVYIGRYSILWFVAFIQVINYLPSYHYCTIMITRGINVRTDKLNTAAGTT